MIAVNSPIIAKKDIFSAVAGVFDFLKKEAKKKTEATSAFYLLNQTSKQNKQLSQVRDILDSMSLEDLKSLNTQELSDIIDNMIDKTEDSINFIDSLEYLSENFKKELKAIYEEQYTSLVSINFIISQKTTQAYLDGKSDTSILQEA